MDTYIPSGVPLSSILVLVPLLLLPLIPLYFRTPHAEKPVPYTVPLPDESKPHWKGRRLNPPSILDPAAPSSIQCYCPATAQFLGSFPCLTRAQIDESIGAAKEAQKTWKKTLFAQRRQVLRLLKQYILRNQDALARVAARDTGKTALCAAMGEILVTVEKIEWLLKHGESVLAPSKRPGPANLLMSYKGAEVRYEPLGVCAALVSWNYPLHNLMGPLIAALFSGNAIVVKCSEYVVWSSRFFIEVARGALVACGHSSDLVQLVYCWPNDADYVTLHPGLNHVTFIGLRPVARHVVRAAAELLTPVVVELGGKDACVVLDDADIDLVASTIMRGTFQSLGQNCIGIERVIATPKAYDGLCKILKERVPVLRLGSDIDQLEAVDMGGMILDTRFALLEKIIADAVADGATLVCGGRRYTHPNYPQGHYFSPTLLIDVTPDMAIAQDECFAPILTLMKAENTEDAIRIANLTDYGLGALVFGNYAECNRVADELEAGNVAINDFATYYVCQLPFGGIKGSGYGKFGGEEGLRGLCVEKSVCYDKLPFVQTKIPKVLDYPIADLKRAWEFVRALIFGGYGGGYEKIKGIAKLARS